MASAQIDKIFLYLSEGESNIQNDVDLLVSRKIIKVSDITSGDSLLVCISRDYYDIPNTTPAIRIRDPISNVFCPKWRINHVKYHALLPFMQAADGLPELYVITGNKEVYDNMDYYLHLGEFKNRFRMLIWPSAGPSAFTEIESEIRRDDIQNQGIMISEILKMAGYSEATTAQATAQVPGWVFQCAGDWMTRVLDLFNVSIKMHNDIDLPTIYPRDRKELTDMLMNPILQIEARVGEDIRYCIIEDQDTRKTLFDLTESLLDNITEV
jgi:hypothetical protein